MVKGQESVLPDDGTFGKIYSEYGQLLTYNVYISGPGSWYLYPELIQFTVNDNINLISEATIYHGIEFEDGTPVRVETHFGVTTRVRLTTIEDGHWEVTFSTTDNDTPIEEPNGD